jgi:hypothetical protein
MTNTNLNHALHRKLTEYAEDAAGFSASEITGHTPEQVRRAAEALVKANVIVRQKLPGSRRVRYFANEDIAKRYASGQQRPTRAAHSVRGSRVKAGWSPDAPARITSRTKIYIAPPLPRNVFRSNTYLQF